MMSASKPETKTMSTEKKDENDKHPGDCPSETCPFQAIPKTTVQTGVLCYWCGYTGSAIDAKIVRCIHFARFVGIGVSPDQKFILVKVRPIVNVSRLLFWISKNDTETLIVITKFFQDLLKKKNLPGLSANEAVAGQALVAE